MYLFLLELHVYRCELSPLLPYAESRARMVMCTFCTASSAQQRWDPRTEVDIFSVASAVSRLYRISCDSRASCPRVAQRMHAAKPEMGIPGE